MFYNSGAINLLTQNYYAMKKTTKNKKTLEPRGKQVSFSVEPGAQLQITVDVGEKSVRGKLPVTVNVEEVAGEPLQRGQTRLAAAGRLRAGFEAVKSRLGVYDLATWLFVSAVAVYLVTRLIGLTRFPIFFFVDEALQTQFVADLIANGYRDHNEVLFPPAFWNGDYFTLGMGVYMQWLPYLVFGKSAVVTRATSVLVTLIAAVSAGLLLRDALRIKYWWAGVLFLSITPTWFLHSRTAFEAAEFVAFYSGALCAYMFYRIKSPRYLYLAIFLGALGFYTYSPGQVLVPFTALVLFVFDWRHHWENRRTVFLGLILLAILAIPYLRFRMLDPDNALAHLHSLGSYLFADISTWEKIRRYFSEYFLGLSAWYWYIPNENFLQRHIMKGYGHIMIATLPFAMLGLIEAIRRVREPSYRIILIAWLVSPVATAFVGVGISRTMTYVFSTALLAAIGFARVLAWIENPSKSLADLMRDPPPSRVRILATVGILVFGFIATFLAKQNADRIVILLLSLLLALQVSGKIGEFARQGKKSGFVIRRVKQWKVSQTWISWLVFLLLSGVNVFMLVDALRNGPTWYKDYGMGGMQYGAFQIFDPIKQYQREHPDTRVLFSPNWANGTDVVARFFLGNPLPLDMHSIQGYVENELPMGDDTLFIMTREEYEFALASEKLADIRVEKTIPYPDGTPGFYFVRLRYSDKADELFAEEKALRDVMQESTIKIAGENVHIRHTYLEADDQNVRIQQVFDGDRYTYAKTYEANPFVMEFTFPAPHTINSFSIITGSANVAITLTGYSFPGAEPVTYTFEGQGSPEQPELTFDLPKPLTAQILHVEQLDVYAVPPTKNHIWELTFHYTP